MSGPALQQAGLHHAEGARRGAPRPVSSRMRAGHGSTRPRRRAAAKPCDAASHRKRATYSRFCTKRTTRVTARRAFAPPRCSVCSEPTVHPFTTSVLCRPVPVRRAVPSRFGVLCQPAGEAVAYRLPQQALTNLQFSLHQGLGTEKGRSSSPAEEFLAPGGTSSLLRIRKV